MSSVVEKVAEKDTIDEYLGDDPSKIFADAEAEKLHDEQMKKIQKNPPKPKQPKQPKVPKTGTGSTKKPKHGNLTTLDAKSAKKHQKLTMIISGYENSDIFGPYL